MLIITEVGYERKLNIFIIIRTTEIIINGLQLHDSIVVMVLECLF